MSERSNTCAKCKFYESRQQTDGHTPWGDCRKDPPKSNDSNDMGFWPSVYGLTGWCGAFSASSNRARDIHITKLAEIAPHFGKIKVELDKAP